VKGKGALGNHGLVYRLRIQLCQIPFIVPFASLFIHYQDFSVWVCDQIEGISTGAENDEVGGLSNEDYWWRCRALNPGHCGYEPKRADSSGSDLDREIKDNQECGKRTCAS
jgi:hypothetical protein